MSSTVSSDRQVVFAYILFGLDRAKVVSENVPEVGEIIERLSKLDQLKRSEEENKICELIPQLNLDSTTRIPSFFHKSEVVSFTKYPLRNNDAGTCLNRKF